MKPPEFDKNVIVRAPQIYELNLQSGTHLQEDLIRTGSFIFMLIGAKSDILFSDESRHSVGRALGSWLRTFHQ